MSALMSRMRRFVIACRFKLVEYFSFLEFAGYGAVLAA